MGKTDKREKRQAVYDRFGGKCFYCGKDTEIIEGDVPCLVPWRFTIDHVVPVAMGGKNNQENLVCACAGCNLRKGDMSINEFREEFVHGKHRLSLAQIGHLSSLGVDLSPYLKAADEHKFWGEA